MIESDSSWSSRTVAASVVSEVISPRGLSSPSAISPSTASPSATSPSTIVSPDISISSLAFCLLMRSSAWIRSLMISGSWYVSQNSSCAVPWRSLRIRAGSFIPGNSTRILPAVASLEILGCETPKRSIRVRRILNALSIASLVSSLITLITSWLVEL
ncbi:MAG: hypothetical protein C5S40_00395 [ANME-2 cluster archaeon]|nr:hypothetical protein [ANME-2 cluster archaeon]